MLTRSLHYTVLKRFGHKGIDISRYGSPMVVTSAQLGRLRQLRFPASASQLLVQYEDIEDFWKSPFRMIFPGVGKHLNELYPRSSTKAREDVKVLRSIAAEEGRLLFGRTKSLIFRPQRRIERNWENVLKNFREERDGIQELVDARSKTYFCTDFPKKLRAIYTRMGPDNPKRELIEGLIFLTSSVSQKLYHQIFALKVDRTETLLEIDHDLALTYLNFRLNDDKKLSDGFNKRNKSVGRYNPSPFQAPYFLQRDSELFRSIVDSCYVAEPHKRRIIPASAKTDTDILYHTPQERLEEAILSQHNRSIPDYLNQRIDCFIKEDLPAIGITEDSYPDLSASFSEFRLTRHFRKKGDALNEYQSYAFFDDVCLHLRDHGTIDKSCLDSLYETVRTTV